MTSNFDNVPEITADERELLRLKRIFDPDCVERAQQTVIEELLDDLVDDPGSPIEAVDTPEVQPDGSTKLVRRYGPKRPAGMN